MLYSICHLIYSIYYIYHFKYDILALNTMDKLYNESEFFSIAGVKNGLYFWVFL